MKKLRDNIKANEHKEKKIGEFALIIEAIVQTEVEYFGLMPTDNKKRMQISRMRANEDDVFITPSIKVFKNANCAACVEYASVAHNILLLVGYESHFFISKDVSQKKGEEGHAFTIVKGDKKSFLFDATQSNFQIIPNEIIDKLLESEEPVIINGICYSNASVKSVIPQV